MEQRYRYMNVHSTVLRELLKSIITDTRHTLLRQRPLCLLLLLHYVHVKRMLLACAAINTCVYDCNLSMFLCLKQGLPDRHIRIKLATVMARAMPATATELLAARAKVEQRLDALIDSTWDQQAGHIDNSQPLR